MTRLSKFKKTIIAIGVAIAILAGAAGLKSVYSETMAATRNIKKDMAKSDWTREWSKEEMETIDRLGITEKVIYAKMDLSRAKEKYEEFKKSNYTDIEAFKKCTDLLRKAETSLVYVGGNFKGIELEPLIKAFETEIIKIAEGAKEHKESKGLIGEADKAFDMFRNYYLSFKTRHKSEPDKAQPYLKSAKRWLDVAEKFALSAQAKGENVKDFIKMISQIKEKIDKEEYDKIKVY